MTHPTSIIEAFRNLLGVDTPNIDNLIIRLSEGNVKGKEGPLLEFKASYVPSPGDSDSLDVCRWNVIKAIVGMANNQGGCVVLGLAENKETKEPERGNGDPDGILSEPGREDKDLAEHTRKALFKGNSFEISDNEKITVDNAFWHHLEKQTNGIKGFVTCRSHVGGHAAGFPVVAIFVDPIPAGQNLISVQVESKAETYTEHSMVCFIRSKSTAETESLVRSKWKTEQRITSKTGNQTIIKRERIDDPENNKLDDNYVTFVNERNPQLALDTLSKKINSLTPCHASAIPVQEVFSSVQRPSATNFVGRVKELAELHDLLQAGRIPIVTGPGGTGKSELVFQYAERHKADYPGGLFQVDAERADSWNTIFRELLETARVDMRRLLGFSERPKEGSTGNASRDPSPKQVADALIRRSIRDGRILLVLDNVESVEQFFSEPIFGREAALPSSVCIVATAQKSDIDFGQDDHGVIFELSDLAPAAAVELLFPKHSDSSEAEQQAAANIAELLDRRPLYICCIRALLKGRPIPFANSYADLESRLRKNLLETVKTAMGKARDEDRIPEVLWQLTGKALSENPSGAALIKLAHMASFFSPDGFEKRILQYLWSSLVGANTGYTFDQALDILRWHWILSGNGNDLRMHRLTAAALRKSARESDANLEEAIGKALGGWNGMRPMDWLAFADNVSVVKFAPRSALLTTPFFPEGPSVQVMILLKNPEFKIAVLWEELSGSDWATILSEQPQFVDRCDWTKFSGRDWAALLSKQPSFADNCPWDKIEISCYDWARLLREQPQFEGKCTTDKFDEFDGHDWAILLGGQPQYADRCPWEKLHGWDWVDLLERAPQFASYCPWEKFGGGDWARLLGMLPAFAEKCDWATLNSKDWARLLGRQPQFAGRCPWELFDGRAWAILLKEQPQFADKCQWAKFDGKEWANLLSEQPQFADCCPANSISWERLSGRTWARLLRKLPQFAAYCPWEKFSGGAWVMLLVEQPQFKDRCPWEKIDGAGWAVILAFQPQFADRCPWEKLDGHGWAVILSYQPQFADRCPWEKLDETDWHRLRHFQSQFADRCPCAKLK